MVKENITPIIFEAQGLIFKARVYGDSTYPGVEVYVNDELVSLTEYNSHTGRVRTIAYNDTDEEPARITDFNKSE